MGDTITLTSENFKSTVATGVTLVDFWAQWCGPCLMMEPALNELAAAYEGKATIARLNVDNAFALAQEFAVTAIPLMIMFKDGEEKQRFVGVTSKKNLEKALDALCGQE